MIVDTERTGPVVRVLVAGTHEDDVVDEAREHLGTDALADAVYWPEGRVWEVIFGVGDLA